MNLEPGLLDLIIKTLGAPGIIIICMGGPSLVMAFMYADHRRYERERLEAAKAEARHQEEMAKNERQFAVIIAQQEKRFETVVTNYENNVLLVEGYQKLANDLAGIIHLNTQMMTKLVEKVDNNRFCPVVREGYKNGL